MRGYIRLIILAGVVLVAWPVSPASAHVSRGSNWYFHSGTKKEIDDSKFVDPLVLLYRDGDTETPQTTVTEDNVVDFALRPDWGRYGPDMKRHGCLQRTTFLDDFGEEVRGVRLFVDGPQGLVFRDLEDGGRDFDKPADFETGTNGKCRNQWHMRWWEDDAPHSTKTNHGSEHQWAIATIHREKYIGVQKGGHSLVNVGGGYWDSYRQVAINRHRGRCRLSRWRMYPGGRRPYQGKDHDGYLGLVEFRQAPGPGNGDNRRCFLDR